MSKRITLLSILGLTLVGLVWAQVPSRKADSASAQDMTPAAATMAGKSKGPVIFRGDCICVERSLFCTRYWSECTSIPPAELIVGVDEPTPFGPAKTECEFKMEIFFAGPCPRD